MLRKVFTVISTLCLLTGIFSQFVFADTLPDDTLPEGSPGYVCGICGLSDEQLHPVDSSTQSFLTMEDILPDNTLPPYLYVRVGSTTAYNVYIFGDHDYIYFVMTRSGQTLVYKYPSLRNYIFVSYAAVSRNSGELYDNQFTLLVNGSNISMSFGYSAAVTYVQHNMFEFGSSEDLVQPSPSFDEYLDSRYSRDFGMSFDAFRDQVNSAFGFPVRSYYSGLQNFGIYVSAIIQSWVSIIRQIVSKASWILILPVFAYLFVVISSSLRSFYKG